MIQAADAARAQHADEPPPGDARPRPADRRRLSVAGLVFVIGLLVVGGLLFLGASVLLGRGETQPPAEVGRSPVELPDDRPVVGDDVRALRISVAFRGYRMTEVDWLVDQLAQVLDERDAEIAQLRAGTRRTAGATPPPAAGRRRTPTPRASPCPPPTRRAGTVPELVEQVDVDAPPEQVWAALVDWDRQGEWMLLTDVRAVDGDGQGVGGRLAAVTGVKLPGRRRLGRAGHHADHRLGAPRAGSTSGTPAGWSAAPAPSRCGPGPAAARRSSGPRGWTCRSARSAGPAGRWSAR